MTLNGLEIIAQTITPIVMMSAVGLVVLMMQNRYARLKDRTILFVRYRNILISKNAPEKSQKVINKLLKRYFKETRLVKDAILSAFVTIGFVVVTCFIILIQEATSSDLSFGILISFTFALISILISVFMMAYSLAMSVSTVKYEIEKMTYEIDLEIK